MLDKFYAAIFSILFEFQKPLLLLSYYIFKIFVRRDRGLWVVGTDEIANNIHYISTAFSKAYRVNLTYNKYYDRNSYEYSLNDRNPYRRFLLRLVIGPVLLGYLANKATGFFYIWKTGFLLNEVDGRDYEFSFLKKRNIKIATFFCGTDIRSLKLSIDHAIANDMEAMAVYQSMLNPAYLLKSHEDEVRKTAESADRYADHIFNAPVDQISYINREVHPFLYMYPDEKFNRNEEKFSNSSVLKIVHAPSSPFIKGTPLIRAAIKKLKVEGYKFDYVEIINAENSVVLEHLKTAHIVINELYAFMPGLFGVEALASHCAVITSARESFEPSLQAGADEAWFVTGYWEIYDHLKTLLDHPDIMRAYADRGYDWAYRHCRASVSSQKIKSLMGL